jgi:hypothetical protein
MLMVDDLGGLWRRSLLAFPDGRRDSSTHVSWLQAGVYYGDLRQPADMPDFSYAAGLDDLSEADCATLARQQGFAGIFQRIGDCFEWVRLLDFQPPGPYADIGRLHWDGDVLVEEGRDVAYLEHWHRDAMPMPPVAALALRAGADAAPGFLLRVGEDFLYARGRAAALPPGGDLAECIAAAAGVAAMRRLLDCEISVGRIAGSAWRIARSSLPFRVNNDVAPRLKGDVATVADRFPDGTPMRRDWQVALATGDISVFFDVST